MATLGSTRCTALRIVQQRRLAVGRRDEIQARPWDWASGTYSSSGTFFVAEDADGRSVGDVLRLREVPFLCSHDAQRWEKLALTQPVELRRVTRASERETGSSQAVSSQKMLIGES